MLPVCAALHLPVRHLHPFPSNVLLATHGGAFGQSFLSNLSFFYCKGSPCVKLWPANQSFAVCNRCHPSWIAVENAPLPHRMRDGSKVSIFTVPVHLYAVMPVVDVGLRHGLLKMAGRLILILYRIKGLLCLCEAAGPQL